MLLRATPYEAWQVMAFVLTEIVLASTRVRDSLFVRRGLGFILMVAPALVLMVPLPAPGAPPSAAGAPPTPLAATGALPALPAAGAGGPLPAAGAGGPLPAAGAGGAPLGTRVGYAVLVAALVQVSLVAAERGRARGSARGSVRESVRGSGGESGRESGRGSVRESVRGSGGESGRESGRGSGGERFRPGGSERGLGLYAASAVIWLAGILFSRPAVAAPLLGWLATRWPLCDWSAFVRQVLVLAAFAACLGGNGVVRAVMAGASGTGGTRTDPAPGQISEMRAGAAIGILERVLVLTLVLLGEFAAIAFVFAAKSVARYRRMEDDPDFADRYLVGTLASTALAVLAGLMTRWGGTP